MSLSVLIIPEDSVHDQHVLHPLVKRMMKEVGRPHAAVRVCTDPRFRGIGEALKSERILKVLSRYRMVDVFLLIVDRDGVPGRRDALDNLEKLAQAELDAGRRFFGECAWQEVEAWALAGQEFPADGTWNTIRDEPNVKEIHFLPFVLSREDRKLLAEPGEGRATLGREAAANYERVRSRCPEIVELQDRIAAWLASQSP